jgi:hypothetical protein
MATKIPQNIDKEDKLVGPLTLKQFLYLLGGAALAFVTYQYYAMGYLYFTEFVIIALAPVTFAVLLAFAQINGRPFITFLSNVLNFLFMPKLRHWSKENHLEDRYVKVGRPKAAPAAAPAKDVNKSQLERLARILDTGGKMEAEDFADTHEINNLNPAPSPIDESALGVEDVLSDVES